MEKHGEELFLELQNAVVGPFPNEILSDLNWKITPNQHWAVVGPNSSGKTLLVETLAGKRHLMKGKIRYNFFGDPEKYFIPEHFISYVSYSASYELANYSDMFYQQRFNAAYSEDFLTTRGVLEKTLKKLDNTLPESEVDARISEVKNILGLTEELLNRKMLKLSNGETKKLILARALVKNPVLLVLDDPFIGLDKQVRLKLQQVINNIIQNGTHVIMVTPENEIPDAITHVLQIQGKDKFEFHTKEEYLETAHQSKVKNKSTEELKLTQWKGDQDTSFQNAVQFKNVTISYDGQKVLNNINWTVKRGERWVVQGGNGSGKSTLLSLIYGDNPQAYSNEIYLFDKRRGRGESIWQIKNKTGYVSPEMHLYYPQHLTCQQVVQSGFTDTMEPVRKLQPGEKEGIEQYLKLIGVAYLQERQFFRISMSEQRLVLLARALVKNPPMLIMDEPSQGLDAAHVELFKHLIEEVCRISKTTLLYVSHYESEIPNCIDSYLVLENGNIAEIRHRHS